MSIHAWKVIDCGSIAANFSNACFCAWMMGFRGLHLFAIPLAFSVVGAVASASHLGAISCRDK